ncbi:YggT family protein [Tepidiforma sp.]|uniref:YggT family protein n=1 Tax=Tepidiforma sp. TaxID=2682230 RepID=UPI003A10119C
MLTWAIIARALISWLPVDQGSSLYQLLFRVTEPIIDPFRRVMPRAGMIDLSPMMAILALLVMQQLVAMLVVPA